MATFPLDVIGTMELSKVGRFSAILFALAIGGLSAGAIATNSQAASVLTTVTYRSSVSSDAGGLLDLKAELNYDNARPNAPIAVVMHGYGTGANMLAALRPNALRLRDAGFFVVSVAMRERDGSDGQRDSGGVEIYDIYDAVEHVKAQYPQFVNQTNVSITGYSGGGGNVMSALTKFPDYFRAGSAYFGMSDYGYDTTNGWFFNGADAGNKADLIPDIGDPSQGNLAVRDRYLARASNIAAKNNPYSEIHLFVNANETNVPPINSTSYRDKAIAAAAFPGEFNKIQVHLGGSGQYQDFNGNGINEANELQDWPHQYPTANQQAAAESWYLSRLLNDTIAQPTLNLQDTLFIAGYVKTGRFSLWLGDGQNAAGELVYDLTGNHWSFDLDILSSVATVDGTLKVNTAALTGQPVAARLNGQIVSQFVGGGTYQLNNFGHNDTLTLTVVVPGDCDSDGDVDGADFVAWQSHFPTASGATLASGDTDGDGDVDGADFVIWQTHFPTAGGSAVAAVPEPSATMLMIAGCLPIVVQHLAHLVRSVIPRDHESTLCG